MLLALPVAAAAAAALVACGSSSPSSSGSSSPAAAGGTVKTATIAGATVLTNSKGFTLYSFAPDTSTKSACNGTCATQWPPVTTTATAVKAPFATIKRSSGATQLTFHGHPLYTFIADKSPGQATGNGVNAFGGLWHEAPATGKAPNSGTSSSGSSGGGYGY